MHCSLHPQLQLQLCLFRCLYGTVFKYAAIFACIHSFKTKHDICKNTYSWGTKALSYSLFQILMSQDKNYCVLFCSLFFFFFPFTVGRFKKKRQVGRIYSFKLNNLLKKQIAFALQLFSLPISDIFREKGEEKAT